MIFKVFSIAWYADKAKAAQDRSLSSFKDMSAEERMSSSEFYDALVSPHAHYDRSILVKMAMSVKKDMLIDGLVQDLNLRPEHSALIAQAGQLFKSPNCERGLELMFTWKASRNGEQERFDIRVNGKKITSISKPGLSEDFFSKFVMANDPVSPVLRKHIGEAFDVFDYQTAAKTDAVSDDQLDIIASSLQSSSDCRSLIKWIKCLQRLRLKRPAVVEEIYAVLFVLFYCILLITQSLPSKPSKFFRVVRLREKLSSFKSNLTLSAEHLKSKAENFAKSISIHHALNHIISADAATCPSVVDSEVDAIMFLG
jgi:hypothetical protein